MATAIHKIADRPGVGRSLIDFCVSRLTLEALRDVPAMSRAVLTCSWRTTVRPICTPPSHDDTACSETSLFGAAVREAYSYEVGRPPPPFGCAGSGVLSSSGRT